eukprot:PhM_4_TR15376/c0_g1_i1/m.12284
MHSRTPQTPTPGINPRSLVDNTPSPIAHSRAVNLQAMGLTSLDGMESSEAVQVLNIQENELTNFYGLPTLPNLKFMHCEGNQISSFLGMSYQPMLEMVSLEGNPISDHPHFRIMALLSCGERLNIINHSVVTTEERDLAARLGGSGGLAAKCISYGWVDFTPSAMTRQDYDGLLSMLKQSYTATVLALDTSRSLAAHLQQRSSRSGSAAVSVARAPSSSAASRNDTPAPTANTFARPDEGRAQQQGPSEGNTFQREESRGQSTQSRSGSTYMPPVPQPYPTNGAVRSMGAEYPPPRPQSQPRPADTPPSQALSAPTSVVKAPPTSLRLSVSELDAISTILMFASHDASLMVSARDVFPQKGGQAVEHTFSVAASAAVHRTGLVDLTDLATGTVVMRLDLPRAYDVVLDADAVQVHPERHAGDPHPRVVLLRCATRSRGSHASALLSSLFKVLLSVKCSPEELQQLYR